jgi:hypothetical protein
MIPSTTNRLLVTQDWTKVYQSFRNADFQSYDFDTLRRVMITYLREKYPEDFNDYTNSSEYIALVDLIAYLGQNLSFRIDLNARENFLETAERRDSIIRLASLISYNVNRNVPASGFLKITNISTTDSIFDANNTNLANATITWNDPTNPEWYQQFITIINNSLSGMSLFGNPTARSVVNGLDTEQYTIASSNTDVPVYSFSSTVNGTAMNFELVSTELTANSTLQESSPLPGRQFSLIYTNDNQGFASSNTGFFIQFKQGTLALSNFSISNPVPNEIIAVNAPNINNTDIWLWQLNASGNYDTLWTKIDSLIGNNVIYNSTAESVRNIYQVLTRNNDQIDLNFADGSFGNLPKGQFKLFYRQSNGLTYIIKPENLSNITVQLPYLNKAGQSNQLTVTLSLQYTVTNATGTESNADIKAKAPQVYYTQNRMVTAEDYNISPLTLSSDIIKVKSINRISSGISKYYELSDVSGKYSKTNIFATDGLLYKENLEKTFDFSYSNRNQALSVIQNRILPILESKNFRNFYMDRYNRIGLNADISNPQIQWVRTSKTTNQSSGYFNKIDGQTSQSAMLGSFASSTYKYFVPGSMIKFVPPKTADNRPQYFLPNGKITSIKDASTRDYVWATIVKVAGDGTPENSGLVGPVILSGIIPSDAIPVEIIPKFVTTLTYNFKLEMVSLILAQNNFGLSYDNEKMIWFIIGQSNLDMVNDFSLVNQKSLTNQGVDSSWMIAFEWDGRQYQVTSREMQYVFESENQTAFFVNPSNVSYDFTTDQLIKDQVSVLSINTDPANSGTVALGYDYRWQIDSAIAESDGYINPKKVVVSFYDATNDGQLDDPDAFMQIVKPSIINLQTGYTDKFIYFQRNAFDYVVSSQDILAYPNPSSVLSPEDGQIYYFYDTGIDSVMKYVQSTANYMLLPEYFAKTGRSGLKFQYLHNSAENTRIDPSKTNLIDLYVLSKSYDTEYRNWLRSGIGNEPLPPSVQQLTAMYSNQLSKIKTISDEIIFNTAKYKILFGSKAEKPLQATFTAVRNGALSFSDNDLITGILNSINDFFVIDNWDFGQSFYFSELSTYVMNRMSPKITNFILVPQNNVPASDMYEIACQSNEIFISGVTANDIRIVNSIPN